MTNQQLLTVLESAYDQTTWLQTIRDVFGPGDYYPRPQAIVLSANDIAETAYELGSFHTATDKRLVGIYEVKVKPGVRIEGKRVGLRQLLKNVYKFVDGALVVFTGHDGSWRFSYISEIFTYDAAGNRQEEKTDSKRFTYVLGKGIHARTPADRFYKLSIKRPTGLSLKDITDAFSVDSLTKDFYRELSDWYFWARDLVTFPDTALPRDLADGDAKHRAKVNSTSTIRLITRLMFVWFIKQKGLVPDALFDENKIKKILKGFQPRIDPGMFLPAETGDATESTYYKAILQNLFFATLNTEMSDTERRFKESIQHREKTEFRYRRFFCDEDQFLNLILDIPFLNGGLFDCLDSPNAQGDRIDCFSDNVKNESLLAVPDYLFFGEDRIVNLNEAYGDTKHGKQTVRGLIRVLNRYNFTVEENTPVDVEVALDPELLGKVFENLLASFNPETETTARKQTGSFYTPREIVEYMVDESLKAYLNQCLTEKHPEIDHTNQLNDLFNYSSVETNFHDTERQTLVNSLYDCKVLDPACGSGAFPLGMLQRMVHLLAKLDPNNNYLVEKAKAVAEKDFGNALTDVPTSDRQQRITDIELQFRENSDDYNRKLVLIEQCLHGVDIQPIAVQITKLRFFISLVVEQEPTTDRVTNRGIRPLPNLETKFVAANTLIGLDVSFGELFDTKVKVWEEQLKTVRHDHFRSRQRRQKLALRRKDEAIRAELTSYLGQQVAEKQQIIQNRIALLEADINLIQSQLGRNPKHDVKLTANIKTIRASIADRQKKLLPADELLREISQLASWNPYDQNSSADFFDAEWMFSMDDRFDIVIGNPPYVRADEQDLLFRRRLLASKQYHTLSEKWDLYVAFLEKGYKLLNEGGVVTMIVSDAYCHAKYALTSQKWFLENAIIKRLDFMGELMIFENVAVHSVIPFFQNGKPTNANQPLRRLHENTFGQVKELETGPQLELDHRAFFPDDSTAQTHDIETVSLETLTYISKGLVVNSDEKEFQGVFKMEDLLIDKKDNEHPIPFVEGKHLQRWLPKTHRWLEWGTSRAPSQFSRITFEELYTAPEKIITLRSPGANPRTSFDNQKLRFNESVVGFVRWSDLAGVRNNSIKKVTRYKNEKPPRPDLPIREDLEKISRAFSVKYLLAIMNSALSRDFLRTNRRSNIHLYPDDWKPLPIAICSEGNQLPFIRIVDYIIFLKAQLLSIDDQIIPAYLEQLIDGLVFELYFPEELHRTGCRFHEHLRELPDVTALSSDSEKMTLCQQTFAKFYDPNHPVSLALFNLRTVPEVAIIEGKEK